MSTDPRLVRDHFLAAVELPNAERQGYLGVHCGSDAKLQAAVERLLAAHDQPASILGRLGPGGFYQTGVSFSSEQPGTEIGGRYKLLESLGEGGMGSVWVAEQTAPVRRKVALKLIKAGMDSKSVLARFEAERQALAVMDHPNIAKVLDGGLTETGRPFFVMEYVKGLPITEYCAAARLSVPERLNLFMQVCHAVQHAHQKGIIHRDLKPSNILVASYDDIPTPKVIDFGIAKATGPRLTEKTVFTNFAQMIGTPLYMSPEQAAMSGLDVDTRTDIYSLGVLFYELLTGTTPFDRERLRAVGYDEMRRIIREEEPAPPSTRLSTLGPSAATVSADARNEARRLSQVLRGELDWMAMKALEKDRSRRYESASAFAADVLRYLHDEPIVACPASPWYRFWKFARRHRAGLGIAAAAILVAVLAFTGLAVSNAQIRQARKLAEERAEQLRLDFEHLQQANALLDRGRWYATERRWDDAHAAFTRAIKARPDHVSVLVERSNLLALLGLWDLAAADYDRQFQLREPDTSTRWYQLALLRLHRGDRDGYRHVCQRMRERFDGSNVGAFQAELIRACVLAPESAVHAADTAAVARLRAVANPQSWYDHYLSGIAEYRAGRYDVAVRDLRTAMALFPAYPHLPLPILAMAHHRLGQMAEAREALEAAGRILDQWTRERYEPREPDRWINHRGATAVWPVTWWDWLECQHYYHEARLLIDGSPPPDDPRLHVLRGRAFAGLRWPARAEVEYAAALTARPSDRQVQFESHVNRAQHAVETGAWGDAAAEFARAIALQPDLACLWRWRTVAQLAAGETEAYRQTCAAMSKHFETTRNPRTASDVIEACVLRQDSLADMTRLLPLVQVASPSRYRGTFVDGAALYRAGRYEDAIRHFEEEAKAIRPRAWSWAFLAMAHSRLGHAEAARRCLADAVAWMAEANRQEFGELTGTRPAWGGWPEPVVSALLVREAETLLQRAEHQP